MNPATTLSVAMASATFIVGALCLSLSRAKGWAVLRWFAVASLLGCCFSITDVFFSIPSTADSTVMWAGRFGGCFAALHVAAWIPYARDNAGRGLKRLDRIAIGSAVVLSVLYLLPNAVYTAEVIEHRASWWDVTYRLPQTTSLAMPSYLVLIIILAYSMTSLWRITPMHGLGGMIRRGSLIFFFGTAVNEALVAAHLVSSPFFLEVGFTTVIVGVGFEITSKFLSDARALTELSQQLDAEVRQRTEELILTQEELAKSERLAALGQLAAGVGHEINNPLSYVMLNLSELRKALAGDKDLEDLTVEALDGAERIRRIVTDLKVLAREEADEDRVAEMGKVLSDAVKLVRPRLTDAVSLDVETMGMPTVHGSPHRLTQVFANLFGNALDALDPKTATPMKIHTELTVEAERVRVRVVDNGSGIPLEHQTRIFEPFFSTKKASQGSGTGLGLAISRAIVIAYGGQIDIESDGRTGTCVDVTLRAASRHTKAQKKKPTATAQTSQQPKRVLVIDDEPLVARAVGRVLQPHHIEIALNGSEALSKLRDEGPSFDVILCDLMLPDVGGADLYEQATEVFPELAPRFLFLTGGAVDDKAAKLLAQPDIRWLQKPVDPEVLVEEVTRVAPSTSLHD